MYVQESFPFCLTRKSAIHRDVIAEWTDNLTDNLMHVKGFAASSGALKQAHLKNFHDAELKYYGMLLWRSEQQLDSGAELTFRAFKDSDGYNGFYPTAHYLSTVWCEWMQKSPVSKLDRFVQGSEGEVRCVGWVQGCCRTVQHTVGEVC